MAFRSANMAAHAVKFNSANSSDFLLAYESMVDSDIRESNQEPKHRTFAPSSFRCARINWFRLRGVQPDKIKDPDRGLEFTANIGTACHEIIQSRLQYHLGDNWLDIEDYLRSHELPFSFNITKKGYESLIEIDNPPVRFACDGLIRFNDKTYLLEIKTSEFSSFNDLTQPKAKHIDQIKCYSALLNIPDVLVLYQDRQYGSMKCFELHFTQCDMDAVLDKMHHIMDMAEACIAPEGLPASDPSCTSNMCPYYNKCKEWGR